jgi:hypothetical protein
MYRVLRRAEGSGQRLVGGRNNVLELSENDSFSSNGHKAIVAKLCLDGAI